ADCPCQQLSNDWLAGSVPRQRIQVALDDDGGLSFGHGQDPKIKAATAILSNFVVHPALPLKVLDEKRALDRTDRGADQPSNEGDSPMANTTLPATISRDGVPHPASPVVAPVPVVKRRSWRRWALGLACLLVVPAVGAYVAPSLVLAISTVSTDDAYVN